MKTKIRDIKDAETIVSVAEKYKDILTVDVIYWRYRVDACSIVAVSGLVGSEVAIEPNTTDQELRDRFEQELSEKLNMERE